MDLKEIFEMEKRTHLALKKFKSDIVSAVAGAEPLPGVTVPEDSNGLNVVYVSIKAVKDTGVSFSPDTYNQKAQADAVERSIRNLTTTIETLKKLKELASKKAVVLSSCGNRYTVKLNSNTLSVLKEALKDFDKVA